MRVVVDLRDGTDVISGRRQFWQLPRDDANWLIGTSLLAAGDVSWGLVKTGEHVLVPVFRQLLPDDPAALYAAAVAAGASLFSSRSETIEELTVIATRPVIESVEVRDGKDVVCLTTWTGLAAKISPTC